MTNQEWLRKQKIKPEDITCTRIESPGYSTDFIISIKEKVLVTQHSFAWDSESDILHKWLRSEKKCSFMTVFKERLYRLMDAAGYSIESLSLETGINQSSLRSYLAGRSDIPVKKLIAIADAFDCSVDYLLGRTDEADMAAWARNYTSTERRIIEKKLFGDSVSLGVNEKGD